ncbi:hypothetical protein BC941DRAFT_419784 [Chlamydoabsidia padenii]|nr:hypothetical protein BC941DRAFT_419784 [Chlamydoabsidia padenii]
MNHASGTRSLDQLFNGMQPHLAFQVGEHEYRRQLTDAVLFLLLDKQDSQNETFRLLLREIIANIVLASLTETLTDPYTIHMIICKLLSNYGSTLDELESTGKFAGTYFSALTQPPEEEEQSIKKQPSSSSSQSIKTDQGKEDGLFTKLRQLQEQQKEQRQQQGVGDPYDDLTSPPTTKSTTSSFASPQRLFSVGYIALQVLLSPFRSLYFYFQAVLTHSQQRYHQVNRHEKKTRHVRLIEPITKFLRVALLVDDRPVVQWGWQMIAMFLWPILRVFGGGLLIDKFLEQTILHVLSEPFIVFYLQLGRDLLWPDGILIKRAPPVTPLQRDQMRIRAERLLVVALPQPVTKTLFGTNDLDQIQSHLHDALAPLQHKYINKHLIYLVLDLAVAKIFPELVHPPQLSSTTPL